ncbi:MAG: hypothetical protein A2171_02545 [Candidatus Levybacteria bacterium RBG_13_35_9]|nr:MAG: hypothetical protein A2171_02545 [Candidatus Levybacteria bacterium RBG_13_35_9]
MRHFEKNFLLDVGFTNAFKQEILEFIYTGLQKPSKKYYIVTPNPELLVIANKNKEYKSILNNAKIALPDGIGVMWGARFVGRPLKQRITGVDFMESLCKYVSKQPITVSFLGGGPSVAEKAAECLRKKYPGLKISWVSQEHTSSLTSKETDILFVALGSPKQEIWISENLQKLNAKVIMGVGGSFDFISGKVTRAPKFLQNLGLEWLFRLVMEPWRIKRQLRLVKFVFLVIKEKFNLG